MCNKLENVKSCKKKKTIVLEERHIQGLICQNKIYKIENTMCVYIHTHTHTHIYIHINANYSVRHDSKQKCSYSGAQRVRLIEINQRNQ